MMVVMVVMVMMVVVMVVVMVTPAFTDSHWAPGTALHLYSH